MFEQLCQHLNGRNLKSCLAMLCNESVVASLDRKDYCHMIKMIQSSNNSVKPSKNIENPKIVTVIYTLCIMKGLVPGCDFNPKMAIQHLCKHYKHLQQCYRQENQLKTDQTIQLQNQTYSLQIEQSKTLKVIAAVLLRIPTFSNYKLIIKDIHPQLVPTKLVLEHRDKMKKQCPNLYDEYLLKRYKNEFVELITQNYVTCQSDSNLSSALANKDSQPISSENNRHSLHEDIRQLTLQFTANIENYDIIGNFIRYSIFKQQLVTHMQYLEKRVMKIHSEEILIEQLTKDVDVLLGFQLSTLNQQAYLLLSEKKKQMQTELIKWMKNNVLQLLRVMINKLKFYLLRKLPWLNQLIISKLRQYHKQYTTVDLLPLLCLIGDLFQIYGYAYFPVKSLLFEGAFSLTQLLRALCYNQYSDQVDASQMNFQNVKNPKQPKSQSNIIRLKHFNSIQSCFEEYLLKQSTQRTRDQLVFQCIQIMSTYFSRANNYSQASHILDILENSKNKLNLHNQSAVSQLKRKLFGDLRQPMLNFEYFCEEVFRNRMRNCKQRKDQEISGQPHKKVKPTLHRSFSMQVNWPADQSQPNVMKDSPVHNCEMIRKTQSFDIGYEGWSSCDRRVANPRGSDKAQHKNEGSQIFYSIKEGSVVEGEPEGGGGSEVEEDGFIVTPNFD